MNKKEPWPTKEAMKQVYELNLWGGGSTAFFSGEGSHCPEIVDPYIIAVTSFLASFECPLKVCDLGCGDFNVGKEFVAYSKSYIAIDIVPELILHNIARFKLPKLEFQCLDIATDILPSGDCAIVRQVLQHLSNDEIAQIAIKLANFKYVILTEHLPEGAFKPNKDIVSGQGIRLKQKSGVDLLVAPFHLKIKEETKLLSIDLAKGKGIIVTSLYVIF